MPDRLARTAQPHQWPRGLYIHIPFCERKCPYCDFNTYAGLQLQYQALVDALCVELGRWQTDLYGREVSSVFFGGGTPTVLEDGQLVQLFEAVRSTVSLSAGCEITCEANPGTVDRAKFRLLRELGVTRLSLGVQSFQAAELQFLGRIHGVADVYRAFDAARAAGIDNINLDFIFGLPNQRPDAWEETLNQALGLAPEHLSLYSLIVEPNTPLKHWVDTGQVDAPDDDDAAVMYELAMECLASANYTQYEVSNWAKRQGSSDRPSDSHEVGEEKAEPIPVLACRQNLIYWRNQEYLGIGPGAHSHLRVAGSGNSLISRRWGNCKPVPSYVRRIRQDEVVIGDSEELSTAVSMGETMMLGLRLVRDGVPFAYFRELHGIDLRQVFVEELARLQEMGFLAIDEERVRLTQRGLLVGNQVFAMFLPEGPDDESHI